MALIKCPECENDISDQSEQCRFCGYPIKESKTTKKQSKRPAIIIICIFLFISLALYTAFFIQTSQKNRAEKAYAANLSQVISTMHLSTSDAEDIGNLVHEVWYNSIFDAGNYETKKYMGNDFNESLVNLFNDGEFQGKLDNLEKSKESATHYMKLLSSPPNKYRDSYNSLKAYYTSYSTLVNAVSDIDESLDIYTDNYTKAKTNTETGYSSVEIYVNQ